MTERAHDELTQRLDRLEGQTRWLNRGLLALLILVGTAMDALYRMAALQIWDSIIGIIALFVVALAIDYRRLGRR